MTEPSNPPDSATFYPVSLDVSGRPCLVVGGGSVAARKARGLLSCGGEVTVVASEVGPEMEPLRELLAGIEERPYASGDAAGYRLVVSATGDPEVDGAVYADADAAGVWVNSADDRAHSSFILPAVHREGAVTVAVSTGGLSPALASWYRSRLADSGGEWVSTLASLLAEGRQRLVATGRRTDSVDWAALLDGPLPALVQQGELDNARAIVDDAVGR
jgi:siroheme synthase-like protein